MFVSWPHLEGTLYMQEEDVRKALDAACSASNVPAQALGQLCRFHRCTGDVSAAKEAGFKWLRASQAHGWQEDEASVADVAACCESLYMCVFMPERNCAILIWQSYSCVIARAMYTTLHACIP